MLSPSYIWPKDEENFLKDVWGYEPMWFIKHRLKKSEYSIKKKAKDLGLPKPTKTLKSWGRIADNFLKENYLKLSNIEIAKKLNELFPFRKKSFDADDVNGRLIDLGLRRTSEQTKIIKRRNVDNGSYKGVHPDRGFSIGHIRLHPNFYNSRDGIRKPAYQIKVSKDRWQLFKHYIWELHWGPIPKGWMISCLNGDELNFRIEDLVLIKSDIGLQKGRDELSDNYVLSMFLKHREDKEEVKRLYKENPEAFKSIIDKHRKAIILNRKIDGKKKNK